MLSKIVYTIDSDPERFKPTETTIIVLSDADFREFCHGLGLPDESVVIHPSPGGDLSATALDTGILPLMKRTPDTAHYFQEYEVGTDLLTISTQGSVQAWMTHVQSNPGIIPRRFLDPLTPFSTN